MMPVARTRTPAISLMEVLSNGEGGGLCILNVTKMRHRVRSDGIEPPVVTDMVGIFLCIRMA